MFNEITIQPLDIIAGLDAAKNTLTTQVKTVVDTIVVPVILIVCVICLIFAFLSLMRARSGGEDYHKEITHLAIAGIITLMFGSWYAWGPLLFT